MEKITYRKTLNVHKNGVQFLLQGFETADNMSRVIEISLMASGDAIDFPLERMVAMMYVTTPGETEPSINKCTIKDNKVIYDMLPIKTEGITTMQLKLIESMPGGAKSVLAAPKFAIEVSKSEANEDGEALKPTFTALEDAIAKAKVVYDERFLRMELSSDCIFRAYYADGSVYETDCLKILFHEGNSVLSESFAKGDTGVRAGEDTDNAKYYSNVARSESLKAKNIMENSEKILDEVHLHGVYTAFSVDFETGEVEYVSPSFKFSIDLETGELNAEGQTYTFENEVFRVVEDWLQQNGVVLSDLQEIAKSHTDEIKVLKNKEEENAEKIHTLDEKISNLRNDVYSNLVGDLKTTVNQNMEDGWLLCNGDHFDATMYPKLYDIIKMSPFSPFEEIGSNFLVEGDTICDIACSDNFCVILGTTGTNIVVYYTENYVDWQRNASICDSTAISTIDLSKLQVTYVNNEFLITYSTGGSTAYLWQMSDPSATNLSYQTISTVNSDYRFLSSKIVYGNGYYVMLFWFSSGGHSCILPMYTNDLSLGWVLSTSSQIMYMNSNTTFDFINGKFVCISGGNNGSTIYSFSTPTKMAEELEISSVTDAAYGLVIIAKDDTYALLCQSGNIYISDSLHGTWSLVGQTTTLSLVLCFKYIHNCYTALATYNNNTYIIRYDDINNELFVEKFADGTLTSCVGGLLNENQYFALGDKVVYANLRNTLPTISNDRTYTYIRAKE